MQDRPTFAELLDAVRLFLETEVEPSQTDHRARFRTLVAINGLTILGRELEREADAVREEADSLAQLLGTGGHLQALGPELAARVLELNGELARRIRAGDTPPGTLEHLRRVGAAKLEVASPKYLSRYG